MYTDRDYNLTSIGEYPPECYFIRVANDDKNTSVGRIQTTLNINFNSIIYLDFVTWNGEENQDKFKIWPAGWKKSDRKSTEYFYSSRKISGNVYYQLFSAGTVKLYGNDGKRKGTYFPIVCPAPGIIFF